MKQTLLLSLLSLIAGALGATIVNAQLIVPPPPQKFDALDGFQPSDRAKLDSIYWNTKAIRGKLFPRIEDGTTIPLN